MKFYSFEFDEKKKIYTDLITPKEQIQKFIEKNQTEKVNDHFFKFFSFSFFLIQKFIEKAKFPQIDNFLVSVIQKEEDESNIKEPALNETLDEKCNCFL